MLKNFSINSIFITLLILLFIGCDADEIREEKSICIDIDGNEYKTVQIGNQIWMAEDLKVTHYRDGTPIRNIRSEYEWSSQTNDSDGGYCNHQNDSTFVQLFGRHYNWHAVNNPKGLAPEGWHIPSDEEWKELELFLGIDPEELDYEGYRESFYAPQLACKPFLWDHETIWINDPGIGYSGFNAIPGGSRKNDGGFSNVTYYSFFWSSTGRDNTNSFYRCIGHDNRGLIRNFCSNRYGFNVRCVKNID